MSDVTGDRDDGSKNEDRTKFWLDLHEKGNTPWHCEYKHPFLARHINQLIGDDGKKRKILIPMCGKTTELSWFAELGHSVVGIEASTIPIEAFFNEHKLQYSVEVCKEISGNLYKAEGVDIKIYCCDLFHFTKDIESEFTAIWDRGAFTSIIPVERQRYSRLLSSLMSNDCRYISITMYSGDTFKEEMGLPPSGPPYLIPLDEVQKLFEHSCRVELLMTLPNEGRKMGGIVASQDFGELIYSISKC